MGHDVNLKSNGARASACLFSLAFLLTGVAAPQLFGRPTATSVSRTVSVTAGGTTNIDFVVNAHGSLFFLVPDAVPVNEPFDIDIWYEPDKSAAAGAVANVVFDRGTNVLYEPAELALTALRRKTVKVTIKKALSGLARLSAYSACCGTHTVTVVSDFRGHVRELQPSTLESRMKHPISIALDDNQNRPLILDADLALRIAAFNAEVSVDGKVWSTSIDSRMQKGAARSDFFYVRPLPIDISSGHIQVTGYTEGGNIAFIDDLPFLGTSPWWLKLLTAMLGAFLYALYKRLNSTTLEPETTTLLRSLGAASLAGLFAYAMAGLNVFGIKVDTTSLQAFLLLGLLTAYAGIEPLLAKVVQRRAERETAENVNTELPAHPLSAAIQP